MEGVIASTKKDRLIWEESFTELIQKSMILAIDNGIETNAILGEFTVKLPIISTTLLKQISEIWVPLWQSEIVDKFSIQNMLPGLNPSEVNKRIEIEKKEAAELSPFNSQTVDDTIGNMQNEKDKEID